MIIKRLNIIRTAPDWYQAKYLIDDVEVKFAFQIRHENFRVILVTLNVISKCLINEKQFNIVKKRINRFINSSKLSSTK